MEMFPSLILPPKKQQTKLNDPNCEKLIRWDAKLPENRGNPTWYWGIDPGVEFGITIIHLTNVSIFQGVMWHSPGDRPGHRAHVAYVILENLIRMYNEPVDVPRHMVIEGAAYEKMYGQVQLAEIRTGFYLAAVRSMEFQDVRVLTPQAIRKTVFDRQINAREVWPTLTKDAAASLSMALTALAFDIEKENV